MTDLNLQGLERLSRTRGQTQHAGSVPQPGIGNSTPLAVGAQILNHVDGLLGTAEPF